jgi:hypothetical protein
MWRLTHFLQSLCVMLITFFLLDASSNYVMRLEQVSISACSHVMCLLTVMVGGTTTGRAMTPEIAITMDAAANNLECIFNDAYYVMNS